MLPRMTLGLVALATVLIGSIRADDEPDVRNPLFRWLTSSPSPTLVTYTPSQLDPRQPANQGRLQTSSIRADLEALRPAFDGLVLYGYHESCTPRIVAVAHSLGFRGVILGIWDPKSTSEIDGVADLAMQYEAKLPVGILVGNEGLTFKRYEEEDLKIAEARLRGRLVATIPLSTSEPLGGYERTFVREFGDFLMPNIHPVFDREQLGPVEAADWARGEAVRLQKETRKPVILKETGFPHAGKPRYTEGSQRGFWESYLKPGLVIRNGPGQWTFTGVAFEAFDLPWKSEESKLEIEKSWGLMSAARVPYPAFAVWRATGARTNPKK